MISFEKIDKYSLRYAALFRYVRFIHRYVYHSNYDIVGKENLPKKGEATLVISNHQNGLMDALGVLFTFRDDRQPVFIARADIFKKETAARLLRFMKIMPAFRTVDVTRSEVGKSAGIFLRAARVLIEGGTVAIFPEAGHESCHHLGTFKKGFPRIAFKAAEESGYELDLKILPMVNHYDNYLNFRQKKTMIIGKPFGFSELYEIYKTKPNDAYLLLNEKCRPVIKEMMLDIEDLNYYDQYDTLRGLYCERLLKKRGKKISYFPYHLAADKEIVNKLDEIKETEPARFECLMNKAQHYQEGVRAFQLRDWVINKKVSLGELILKSVIMLLLFPLFLFGFINNYLPFNASRLLT
ncbi:MAG: 1-acyl-sn-glycerol-3-phosphate acyltransferase, partial [Bacteroidales bacterium]